MEGGADGSAEGGGELKKKIGGPHAPRSLASPSHRGLTLTQTLMKNGRRRNGGQGGCTHTRELKGCFSFIHHHAKRGRALFINERSLKKRTQDSQIVKISKH